MSLTTDRFATLLIQMGSNVVYHREDGGDDCPCKTPEGFRDPAWHRANPGEPVCNEQGFINPTVIDITVKAAVQPPRMRGNRGAQRVDALLGAIESGDRIGIFPTVWDAVELDFTGWSDAGEDYITYDGHRYVVVEADKIPDVDGDPNGHWEVGLRLVKNARPS